MKFIFGQEEYLVDMEIKKILKEYTTEAHVYDETITIENIIMDISTISMFSNEKVIVIRDHPIFIDKNEGQKFLNDFQEINLKDVNLIFALTLKYQESNPLIKYLMKNADIKEIKNIRTKDLWQIIYQLVEQNGAKISNGAIIKLIQKFPLNLRLIINEVKKLLLESKNITEEQINKSVDNYYSENYFALSNAIVDKNKSGIIRYYNEKITYGEQPISIIGQIAITLNLSILVDNYKKQGFSLKEISNKLKIHIFRIKKANDLILDQNSKKIGDLVIKLANLEADIKTGTIDNIRGLDRFVLELIK